MLSFFVDKCMNVCYDRYIIIEEANEWIKKSHYL